jgi:hypothetical protein
VDETFVMGNGIDIHNAARAAERPTQEVVRFILKKDYKMPLPITNVSSTNFPLRVQNLCSSTAKS